MWGQRSSKDNNSVFICAAKANEAHIAIKTSLEIILLLLSIVVLGTFLQFNTKFCNMIITGRHKDTRKMSSCCYASMMARDCEQKEKKRSSVHHGNSLCGLNP